MLLFLLSACEEAEDAASDAVSAFAAEADAAAEASSLALCASSAAARLAVCASPMAKRPLSPITLTSSNCDPMPEKAETALSLDFAEA